MTFDQCNNFLINDHSNQRPVRPITIRTTSSPDFIYHFVLFQEPPHHCFGTACQILPWYIDSNTKFYNSTVSSPGRQKSPNFHRRSLSRRFEYRTGFAWTYWRIINSFPACQMSTVNQMNSIESMAVRCSDLECLRSNCEKRRAFYITCNFSLLWHTEKNCLKMMCFWWSLVLVNLHIPPRVTTMTL